jgi:hypothetical protein
MSEHYFNLTSFLTSLSQEELLVYERTKRFLKLEKKLFNTILTQPKIKLVFNFSTQDGIYSILALIEALDSILNDCEIEVYNKSNLHNILTVFHNEKSLVINNLNYDQSSENFSNIQLEIYEFLR